MLAVGAIHHKWIQGFKFIRIIEKYQEDISRGNITNENKYRIINQLDDILELEEGDRKDVFLQLLLPTTKKCSRKMRSQLDWRICDKVGIWSFEGPLVFISSSRAPLYNTWIHLVIVDPQIIPKIGFGLG